MENLDKLKELAEALLEYETLDGAEIDVLFAGKPLDRPPPASTASRRTEAAKAAAARRRAPGIFPAGCRIPRRPSTERRTGCVLPVPIPVEGSPEVLAG